MAILALVTHPRARFREGHVAGPVTPLNRIARRPELEEKTGSTM